MQFSRTGTISGFEVDNSEPSRARVKSDATIDFTVFL